MDSNGSQVNGTGHEKEKRHVALAPFTGLVSGPLDTNAKNGNGHVSPIPYSGVSQGAVALTAQSVQIFQQHSAASAEKPNEAIVSSQDERKEEVSYDSPHDHEKWFHRFVNAVDHEEACYKIRDILTEGKQCGYLNKYFKWEDDQYTSLHYAAHEGKLEVVKELVSRGVPVDIRTGGYKRTPLHLASQGGHFAVVDFLVESKQEVLYLLDRENCGALQYAALGTEGQKNVEIIEYLIRKGLEPIEEKGAQFNLLHLAVRANNVALVRYLAREYPYMLCREESCGNVSPLDLAKYMHRKTIIDILEPLHESPEPDE
jgi:hypothetical protein